MAHTGAPHSVLWVSWAAAGAATSVGWSVVAQYSTDSWLPTSVTCWWRRLTPGSESHNHAGSDNQMSTSYAIAEKNILKLNK